LDDGAGTTTIKETVDEPAAVVGVDVGCIDGAT
jgi:hypothetical protein